jgi:tetratricopeptide (TPR) repeat protein
MERSTGNFPYRKVFCWGTHAGGRHWQRFLAGKGSGDYLEVQAGLARTQVHSATLPGNRTLSVTQQFTADIGVKSTAGDDNAQREIHRRMERLLPVASLEAMHEKCSALSTKPTDGLLHMGCGWGALEKKRDPASVPAHLDFPDSTLSHEQTPWLRLLAGEAMTECASFMVSKPWISLMEESPAKTAVLWNQLGVAYLENGRPQDAKAAWDISVQMEASPLAYRNLSCLASRQGQPDEALSHMENALAALSPGVMSEPYAIEYLNLLAEAGRHAEAFAYYRSLPGALQKGENVRLAVMTSAFHQNEEDFLSELFDTDFSVIREGDTALHEIWFMREARDRARLTGEPLTEELLLLVKETVKLPEHLDFRFTDTRIN